MTYRWQPSNRNFENTLEAQIIKKFDQLTLILIPTLQNNLLRLQP